MKLSNAFSISIQIITWLFPLNFGMNRASLIELLSQSLHAFLVNTDLLTMRLFSCIAIFGCILFRTFSPMFISEVGRARSFLALCVCFWCQGCKSCMSCVWSVSSLSFSAIHYRRGGLLLPSLVKLISEMPGPTAGFLRVDF